MALPLLHCSTDLRRRLLVPGLLQCHVQNELSKALSFFQYAIQLEPSATGYFYRAVTHDAQGDYLRALQV